MARRLYSEAERRKIAEKVALGVPKEAIAAEIGCEPKSLTALLSSRDMRERVDYFRAKVASVVQVSMTRLTMGLEEAVSNILDDIRDPQSKTRLESSWRLIDRVVPKQTQQDVTVHHVVDGQILADISHTLKAIKPYNGSVEEALEDPHLLSGEAALPKPEQAVVEPDEQD